MTTGAEGNQILIGKVREFLSSRFDRDELEILCSDLGIDPENVPGADKSKEFWAQQIVLHFSRRDAIDALVTRARAMRPNAPWGELDLTRELRIEQVAVGVMALQDLMRKPDVLKEVAVLAGDLDRARDQLRTLRNYKELHDQLHELQFSFYIPAYHGRDRFSSDPLFRQDLDRYSQAFSDVIEALNNVADRNKSTMSGEKPWIERLGKYYLTLENALAKTDEGQFKKCLERVDEVIGVKPAEINARLKDATRSLSLSDYLLKLKALHEKLRNEGLDDASQARLQEFNDGIQSMQALWEHLSMLVGEHDVWQEAEDQMKRLNTDPVARLYDEDDGWTELNRKLDPLCRASGERWAARMLEDAMKLQEALDKNDAKRIAEVFGSYRFKAGSRFYVVDKDLLQECSRIAEIGPRLDVVFKAA